MSTFNVHDRKILLPFSFTPPLSTAFSHKKKSVDTFYHHSTVLSICTIPKMKCFSQSSKSHQNSAANPSIMVATSYILSHPSHSQLTTNSYQLASLCTFSTAIAGPQATLITFLKYIPFKFLIPKPSQSKATRIHIVSVDVKQVGSQVLSDP